MIKQWMKNPEKNWVQDSLTLDMPYRIDIPLQEMENYWRSLQKNMVDRVKYLRGASGNDIHNVTIRLDCNNSGRNCIDMIVQYERIETDDEFAARQAAITAE